MKSRLRVLHFADKINRFDFIDNIVRNLSQTRIDTSHAGTYLGWIDALRSKQN